MKRANPKSHDPRFKCLITSFTTEFLAHYFPDLRIGQYTFIDKEFIRKYEALTESLKGDLFLLLEAEIDGDFREIAVQIEPQSEREDVSERVFEYLCYVRLWKKKPVWSMVIYTDEAIWKKPVAADFWYAFYPDQQKQFFRFSVIKVKAENSSELIHKQSLLCKLLALKANDAGTAPAKLISKIYSDIRPLLYPPVPRTRGEAHSQPYAGHSPRVLISGDTKVKEYYCLKEQLTANQLSLITQWVVFYLRITLCATTPLSVCERRCATRGNSVS